MFEDLDDPAGPEPTAELRQAVVLVAARRRLRRRLIVGAVAVAAVAIPAYALTASGSARRVSITTAGETTALLPSSSTVFSSATTATRQNGSTATRPVSTPTTWNGVLHCDTHPTDRSLDFSHRFGRWMVTTRSAGDHQTLTVQDCASGRSRVLPPPPPGRACFAYGYEDFDMGADVLLYRCEYGANGGDAGTHEIVVHDLTTNKVQIITEAPDRPWLSGSMAPTGKFVVFTGSQTVYHQRTPSDVFVFEVSTAAIDRLPRDYGGATNRDGHADGISGDGRTVLLSSWRPPGDPSTNAELYLFDRQTRQFSLVPTSGVMVGSPALSGDGHHVAINAKPEPKADNAVYAYDVGATSAELVSRCTPDAAGNPDCKVGISEDGRRVTFTAWPCIAVTGTDDRSGGTYTFDRSTGTIHKDAPFDGDVPCPPQSTTTTSP